MEVGATEAPIAQEGVHVLVPGDQPLIEGLRRGHTGARSRSSRVDGIRVGDEVGIGGMEAHVHPPTVASGHVCGPMGRHRRTRDDDRLRSVGWLRRAGDGSSGPGGRRAALGGTVTRIVDGDTIHVDLDGRDTTIRIIGIDTPEKDGPYTDEECFGQEATRYTEQALAGQRGRAGVRRRSDRSV